MIWKSLQIARSILEGLLFEGLECLAPSSRRLEPYAGEERGIQILTLTTCFAKYWMIILRERGDDLGGNL